MEQYTAIKYQLLEGGHHLHIEEQVELVAERIRDFFQHHPFKE
jgi:hypothetical protein